jgi:low affinity Fe/Cu permease
MKQWIHFDDNIFFLSQYIRLLLQNLKLNIDGSYFDHKVDEDIRFLSRTLSDIYTLLCEQPQNFERNQNLRFLAKNKMLFAELLDMVVSGSLAFSLDLTPYFQEYSEFSEQQRRETEEIRDMLKEAISQEDLSELISQEEYRFLLGENEG